MAFLSVSAFAQKEMKADPMHSKVAFTVEHLGITDVNGQFKEFEIIFTPDAKNDLTKASIRMTADVASIDTGVEMRDKHLKSEDFFNVAKERQMGFKSTAIKKVAGNKYKVTGELYMNGVNRTVTMDLLYRGTAKNPAANNEEVTGIQVTGTIKRLEFGIGLKFPESMISDEIQIKFDGEFKKS